MYKNIAIVFVAALLVVGCHNRKTESPVAPKVDYTKVAAPVFNADSAMSFAEVQLRFGPRIPGSKAWDACAQYLVKQLGRWCDTVVVQPFHADLWDGHTTSGRNIIASLNPTAPQRVLLAAHWDSRSWADHDPDPDRQHDPVPGANDGASGVAVLMEMSRVMSAMPPSVGVDFILFDVEDQGVADWSEAYDDHSWCKGSQYWSQTPHIPYYRAVYGVLFDMVGTPEPRFTKEMFSRQYAPGLTDKIWSAAAALGYGDIFVDQRTDAILDDHVFVNQQAGIPMVDIVQNAPDRSFFVHWHTTRDDAQSLRPASLEAVARVVLTTLYADYPHAQ